MRVSLKPQDLYICLKLVTIDGGMPSFGRLAGEVLMSPSQVYSAVGRATAAGLLDIRRRPRRQALLEFILHGVRYAFYPERGSVTRGVPTAHAAPPIVEEIAGDDLPPVWPDPEGTARGESLAPLHRMVPQVVRNDHALYELLALVDVRRIGRAREQKLAAQHLERRLKP
jgi:hypothetical protein